MTQSSLPLSFLRNIILFSYCKVKVFILCFGVYLLLTWFPFLVTKKTHPYSPKYISRNWMAVTFPAVLSLYMIMVDGMDILTADVTKYVIIWAIAQGIIFSISEMAQKINLRKGDWELNVEASKKENK